MAKRYKCPGCGKRVKFGTHYCTGDNRYSTTGESRMDDPHPEYRESSWFRVGKRVLIVLIAAILILFLLFQSLGIYLSLVLVGVMTIIAVAVLMLREYTGMGTAGGSGEFKALVRALHGDREAAERMISAEMQSHPDFSRKECVRRVYDRLIYDRSR